MLATEQLWKSKIKIKGKKNLIRHKTCYTNLSNKFSSKISLIWSKENCFSGYAYFNS